MTRVALTLLLLAGALTAASPAASGGGSTSRQAHTPEVTVRLGEFWFRPATIHVHRGTTVRFLNVGRIEHTVADSTRRWQIRSQVIHPRPLAHDASQTVLLSRIGTIYYLCTFHPTLMRGRIVVTP